MSTFPQHSVQYSGSECVPFVHVVNPYRLRDLSKPLRACSLCLLVCFSSVSQSLFLSVCVRLSLSVTVCLSPPLPPPLSLSPQKASRR